VETALQHIEMVSNMILAKRMIKSLPMKPKSITPRTDIELMNTSTHGGSGSGGGRAGGGGGTGTGGGQHSPSGLLENDQKSLSPSLNGNGNGKKKKECDGMEQALILKGELDRVLSGVKLLGDTVDRLNDIVRSDSRCCSGAFDSIWFTLLGSTSPLNNRVEQGGYSSVRLDDSAHG
jgi:hypothetical protein